MAYIKNPSEDICLPMRLSMRKTHCGPHGFAYHNHWHRSFYKWLDKFLSNSIGKPLKYIHRKISLRYDIDITITPLGIVKKKTI